MKPTNQINTADFFSQPLPQERRPNTRPKNERKGKDFRSMLDAQQQPKREAGQKVNSKTARPLEQQSRNEQVSHTFNRKPQEWAKSPTIKKPSRALRSWGKMLTKSDEGLQRFPALNILGGMPGPEIVKQLPELLSNENSFLTKAVGSNLKILMHAQFKVADLAQMLGISKSFTAEAEKLGIDPQEVISPKQFFQSLGIDPNKVIARLEKLKTELAKNGLSEYVNPSPAKRPDSKVHTHDPKKSNMHANQHPDLVLDSDNKLNVNSKNKAKTLYPIKKLSESPELNDLWQPQVQAEIRTQDSKPEETKTLTNLESKLPKEGQLKPLTAERPTTAMHTLTLDKPTLNNIHSNQERPLPGMNMTAKVQHPNQIEGPASNFIGGRSKLDAGLQNPRNFILRPENKLASPWSAINDQPSTDQGQTKSAPRAFADVDVSKLLKPENRLNKSLNPEYLSLADESVKSQATENLQVQAPSLRANQSSGHDLDLDLDTASIEVRQFLQKESFENIQRQLKSPFLDSELRQVNMASQVPDEVEAPQFAHQLPASTAEKNSLVQTKNQTTGIQFKPSRTPLRRHSIPDRPEEMAMLDQPLQKENLKNFKVSSSSQNFETADLDQLFSPPTRGEVVTTGEPSEMLNSEMTFESRQEMLDKISEQSGALQRQGGGRANIAISDKNIGELALAVNVDGNEVQVKMHSPSDQMRNLLGQDLQNLKETLSNQNLNLVQVDVSNNEYGHDSSKQHNHYQLFEQQHNQQQYTDNPKQIKPLKAFKKNKGQILGTSSVSHKPTDMGHNLLSKHIQVAA